MVKAKILIWSEEYVKGNLGALFIIGFTALKCVLSYVWATWLELRELRSMLTACS